MEARNAYHKKHYNSVREKFRANARKYKYSVTREIFDVMIENQGGKCAICNVELSDEFGTHHAPNKLVIDHCHETNLVRGILCTMCNKALGLFKDNINNLKQASKYLEDFYGALKECK